MIDCLRYYAGWADKIEGRTIPIRGDYFCYTRREPVGVVGQIIPWNFPALMTAWKWGPALAAGCTIVMKPAEQTPLSCLRMARLAQKAGIPDGVINVVPGYGPTAGAAIVKHPGVDKIAFTGELATAKIIQREAAETMKRLTFELGGKSPNVIFADADLDAAIEGATSPCTSTRASAAARAAGCSSKSESTTKWSIGSRRRTRIASVGDPFDPETQQGPQVDEAQFDKILQVRRVRQEGRREDGRHGGKRVGDKGYFVEPTLFSGVTDDMRIATDEIFGPVLSVLKFKNVDEIIKRSNNTNFGLAAAVWTRDVAKAHRYAASVRAGTVWINCYDVFDAAAPFGGFKQSGLGRELGEAGLANYTELKTVTVSMT